eukprot:Phypoly_transcript_07982.p1 GENE.Phypoly_transcript_07982~~Phypoly_transcript_07982.p1  ORF type:complete len:366 (-),score=53.61 Phypoly_transcript_07982:285-1382(-)
MATFASPLLMSDEAILQLGVKPHDVEVFRRRQYQFSFGIHTWYAALAPHTFYTSMFDLSYHEAKAITACHHHRPTEGNHLLDIKTKLDYRLKNFPNGAFIKLDTRSPKDVPVYAFQNETVRKLLDSELEALNRAQLEDDDVTTAAFVRATNKYMKVTTGEEALNLLVLSDRVSEDLDKALEYGEKLFTGKVVLREWIDEVPEHPEMEFRGFVHKNQLNALTQYFSFVRFPHLVANRDKILARIIAFFESVKHLITHESYVIDFFVLEQKVIIIELNPFHNGAGAGLFSWKADRKLFMEGPFEFRITDSPAAERVPTDVLPLFWQRYIQEKRQKLLEKNGYKQMVPVLLLATYGFWRISTALLKNM